jgi:muramoyltetrapeptide carboxypeptidase
LLGTNLDFDTTDKILFIEDVGEQLYQIDRMIMALKKAGKFDALKALLVGQFSEIPSNNPSFGISLEDIILEHTSGKYPVVFDAPIGHITNNYPLILGHDLSLSQEENLVTISQPAVTKI